MCRAIRECCGRTGVVEIEVTSSELELTKTPYTPTYEIRYRAS
jgi:hypothetical protein